jgi:cellulose synthase (UDP-forming)
MVEPESTAGGTERGRRAADLTDADLLPTRAG